MQSVTRGCARRKGPTMSSMQPQIKWVANHMPKGEDKNLQVMSLDNVAKARAFHKSFPQYSVTPLADLDGMAKRLGLDTLRDATMEMLDAVRTDITAEDYFRAKFVIEEKDRVLAVCDALNAGDYETVGRKMYETHRGLSKDYEVSCEELDFLNDIARECGVTGSRIMGGGFGGCTINLVKDELLDKFVETAKVRFKEKYGHEPKVYPVVISDGARKL